MVTRVVNRHRRISPRRFNFISDRACNNDFATRSRHHGSQNIYRKTTMPILECLKRRLQDDFAQSINKARSRGKIKRNEARPRGKFPDPLSSNLNDNEGGRGEGEQRRLPEFTIIQANPSSRIDLYLDAFIYAEELHPRHRFFIKGEKPRSSSRLWFYGSIQIEVIYIAYNFIRVEFYIRSVGSEKFVHFLFNKLIVAS